MTRNSRKLKPQTNSEYKEPPKQEEAEETEETEEVEPTRPQPPKQPDNPFGLSFVSPVETIVLPSGGEYYPVSSPVHGIGELEIKHMTAKEEDILSSASENDVGSFDKLIDSLLQNTAIRAEDLLEEDKMAILLQARITGYGPSYESVIMCAECNKRTNHAFDLTKSSVMEVNEEDVAYNSNTDTFRCILGVSDIEVELENFSSRHERELDEEKEKKVKYNLDYNYTTSFLEKVLVSANDVTDANMLKKLISVLPAADAKQIVNFYSSCRPILSTKQDVSCEVCKAKTEREAPISWAFFRTDI